jgi:hypothetical protein
MVTTSVVISRRPCPFAIVRLGRAGDSPRRHEVHEDFLGMARVVGYGMTLKSTESRCINNNQQPTTNNQQPTTNN